MPPFLYIFNFLGVDSMNTYVTITVNCPSDTAILCAHNTLLSFDKIEASYLKENIHTTYARIKYPVPTHGSKVSIACLVTAQASANNFCTVTLTANVVHTSGLLVGSTHEFAAEFLSRFSEAIENTGI